MPEVTTNPTAPAAPVKPPVQEVAKYQWGPLNVTFAATTKKVKPTKKQKDEAEKAGKKAEDKIIPLVIPVVKSAAERTAFVGRMFAAAEEKTAGSSEVLFSRLLNRRFEDASDMGLTANGLDSEAWLNAVIATESAGLKTVGACDDALIPISNNIIELFEASKAGPDALKKLGFVDKNGAVDTNAFNLKLNHLMNERQRITEIKNTILEKKAAAEAAKPATK